MNATQFASRKNGTMTATILRKNQQRATQAAEGLSRLGLARAGAELCNESILRLIGLVYEVDPDTGLAANLDLVSLALLVPVPWGRQYRLWGLRATESRILGAHMFSLASMPKPLFWYCEAGRRWHVNAPEYNYLQHAQTYWGKYEISATAYAKRAQRLREQGRERKRKVR